MSHSLNTLLKEVRSCSACQKDLPHTVRPVLRADPRATILVVGQAPGTRVHASGIPWDDKSGKRLREWMDVGDDIFYDETKIAIVPMGFCYPGKGKSGDLPPRKECAPLWHTKILDELPHIELTLLIGQYAQNYYLPTREKNLTATVKAWKNFLPYMPLPHPSPRNFMWLKKNPWFGRSVVPALRALVADALEKR